MVRRLYRRVDEEACANPASFTKSISCAWNSYKHARILQWLQLLTVDTDESGQEMSSLVRGVGNWEIFLKFHRRRCSVELLLDWLKFLNFIFDFLSPTLLLPSEANGIFVDDCFVCFNTWNIIFLFALSLHFCRRVDQHVIHNKFSVDVSLSHFTVIVSLSSS